MNVRLRVLILISLSLPLWLAAQPASRNFTLLGELTYNTTLNDIWGYADEQGNEYAIVGTGTGPSVVDVTDPANPVELFFPQRPYSFWRDMKHWGSFCYVSNETSGGLQILDLSDLPNSMPVKDTIIQGVNTIHNLWIDEKGFLYLLGTDVFNGGVVILDVKDDPWRPRFVGAYSENYVHDIYVRNDTGFAAELSNGLTLIDLSDRTNPFSFSNQNYPNSFTHNTWLNDAGDFCFTTDETFTGFIRAFDVSDPTNMFETDRIKSELSFNVAPHNVHVLNDFLVISHYTDGITLVDGSDPENLAIMGYYDTSPLSGQGFNGCWGAYPFLPSGNVLATDIQTGLKIFSVNYERVGHLNLTVLDSATQSPVTAAEVSVDGQLIGFTDNMGKITVPVDSSRQANLDVEAVGYASVAELTQLLTNQTSEDTVYLASFARGDVNITLLSAEDSMPLFDAQLYQEVIVVNGTSETLDRTDSLGKITQTQTLIGQSRLVAGKWGYKAVDTSILTVIGTNNITLYLEVGYEDDFFFDFDWQVGGAANPNGWERVEPNGSFLPLSGIFAVAPNEDVQGDLGTTAYVTGAGQLNANPETFDLDGQVSELLSPPFSIKGYEEPRLDLSVWLANLDFNSSTFTKGDAFLEAEILLGAFPVTLFEIDSTLTNSWLAYDSLVLPRFDQPVQLRFRAWPGVDSFYFEAGIDAIQIYDAFVEDTTDTTSVSVLPIPSQTDLKVLQQNEVEVQIGITRPEVLTGEWTLKMVDIRGAALYEEKLAGDQVISQVPFDLPGGVYVVALYQDGFARALIKLLHP